MHRTLTLLFALLTLVSLTTPARDITPQQARACAERFFAAAPASRTLPLHDTPLQLVTPVAGPASRTTDSRPAYYIFNRGTHNGFIIISADDTTRPVLAYAYQGTFTPTALPANVRAWLQSMARLVSYRSTHPASAAATPSSEWDHPLAQGRTVDLDTPIWDQDSPYNLKCPVIYGTHCYTGCAITATAIVMGYHQWPDQGTGTLPPYTTSEHKFRIGPIPLGEPYQWSQMPYINGNTFDWNNPTQADAVATLMYHVGVMGRADYTTYGTSATLRAMADGLPLYMKYNPQLRYLERRNYTDEEWTRMLRTEIDARRPVIYEGYDENEGHAFVIDGYNEAGYFKVNWGWGGRYNAFFLLSDMAPGMQGIGANGSGTYNLSQAGIFGLQPRPDSEVDLDDLQYITSQSFSSGLVAEHLVPPVHPGDGFWIDTGILRNMGSNMASGTLRFAMTDHQGRIIESYKDEQISQLPPSVTTTFSYNKFWITIGHEVRPGYRLRLLFQPQGTDQWKPVTCSPEVGQWEILLMDGSPEDDPTIGSSTSLHFNAATRLVTLTTLPGVTASLTQPNGADCTSALHHEGTTLTIDSKTLRSGLYTLTLSKGNDVKTLQLRF